MTPASKTLSPPAPTSTSSPTSPRKRQTAAARREVLVEVARRHFAERGYYGTPTQAMADEAGISQAYLFRLYPTKQDLFAATVAACIVKTVEAFERGAAAAAPGESVLDAMGQAYGELLASDDTVLMGQLHANAAAINEPKIRAAMRAGWAELYELVERLSGADPEEIRTFFAGGMLLNVGAAVGFDEVDEPWAHALGHKE